MVAPLRRLLLALVALAGCTPDLFGGVVCTPNGDGTWTCSGDGTFDPDNDPYIVTNIVGVCSNCVAMLPQQCESYKNSIKPAAQAARDYSVSAKSKITEHVLPSLNELKAEGDSFYGPGPRLSLEQAQSTEQWPYVLSRDNKPTSSVSEAGASVNSIANYYQQAVKPVLEESVNYLNSSVSDLDQVYNASTYVLGIVDQINCEACTASFDGPPVSTNSPSGGGSSSSGGCPCKEQMEALQSLLKDDFLPRVKRIDSNVEQLTNIIAIAKKQLEVTRQGFNDVTNLFNRLDDYVLDDFSNRVFQITYDVNFIASNLAAKVKQLEPYISTNYWNAVQYKDNDNDDFEMSEMEDKLIDLENKDQPFDFGEFGKLPWFSRIEFLLLHMSGMYSLTNAISGGTTNYNGVYNAVNSSSSGFVSAASGAESSFDTVKTAFNGFTSSVKSAFGENHDAIKEINLIDNFLGTQDPLVLKIDPDVIDACRVITSLLWTAGFAILLFRIVIVFWMYCSDVVWFIMKHINMVIK